MSTQDTAADHHNLPGVTSADRADRPAAGGISPVGVRRDGGWLHVGFRVNLIVLLEAALWLAALTLGARQAWASRFYPSSIDAVAYLDVGDAYMRADWTHAINGCWNPLYSWCLGVVVKLVAPPPELEFAVAKSVDFALFAFTLAAFGWFLREIRLSGQKACAERPAIAAIPDWLWIGAGYTLFMWSSLKWITLTGNTPDMCSAGLGYAIWGLVLRLERRERRIHYPLLGALLALGYFARTPMFIVGWALLALLWVGRTEPRRKRGLIVAGVVFLVLTTPFIAALSVARGHLTIGQNGALNHAWLVNPGFLIIPNRYWQGGPEGYGTPLHPVRKLWDAPPAYEFASPVGGTYPPWTDPSVPGTRGSGTASMRRRRGRRSRATSAFSPRCLASLRAAPFWWCSLSQETSGRACARSAAISGTSFPSRSACRCTWWPPTCASPGFRRNRLNDTSEDSPSCCARCSRHPFD